MGHNFDYPGAWEAAERDLKAVLNVKPAHEGALLELGLLYVGTSPELAPKAEVLFRAAQEAHGKETLEDAQRGLFFAYYYQGKMSDAVAKAEFLTKTWPNVEMYQRLLSMAKEVAARKKPIK
jgi:hypothetical protein